ncbi:hypothetical protein [Roseibium sediminis]|uniref:hypothetical protein n=1 Tax=Roseibium sediminis TaxID=1775174 RepID=UPI00123C932C|nr:hypothetical protein [Roseibium sediminis]
MTDISGPSDKLYRSIANWPFFLRCLTAYTFCVVISAAFIVFLFFSYGESINLFSIIQSILLVSMIIGLWGSLLFLPATAIAEFFEIRNIGYYLFFGTLNAQFLFVFAVGRIKGTPVTFWNTLEYMTSILALLICVCGVFLGGLYWWMAGQFARRSLWFGRLEPHVPTQTARRARRVY